MLGARVKEVFYRSILLVFVCGICSACMDGSEQNDLELTLPAEVNFTMLKGARQVLNIESQLPPTFASYDVHILEQPVEGVLFQQSAKSSDAADHHGHHAELSYQHGGASMKADRFVFRLEKDGVAVTDAITAIIAFREGRATVAIKSPLENEIVLTDELVVAYETAGSDFNHLHISIDNLGHNTIRELTGRYTLAGLTPGKHVVSAQLVDENHRPVKYANSSDSVNIIVKHDAVEKTH